MALLEEGETQQGQEALETALALVSGRQLRLTLLGDYTTLLASQNQWAKVLRQAKEALRLVPNDPGWLATQALASQLVGASSDWQLQGQQVPPPGWNQPKSMPDANSWSQPRQQPNIWGDQQKASGQLYQPTLSIFMSHSAKDNDFGRKLVQDLRQALGSDESVWYDSEGGLYAGDSWWTTIVTGLEKCNIFIIILSPDSMKSKWVMKELEIAIVEGKRVVPILFRQCDIRADLRAIQYISFLEPIPFGVAFNNLLKALKH